MPNAIFHFQIGALFVSFIKVNNSVLPERCTGVRSDGGLQKVNVSSSKEKHGLAFTLRHAKQSFYFLGRKYKSCALCGRTVTIVHLGSWLLQLLMIWCNDRARLRLLQNIQSIIIKQNILIALLCQCSKASIQTPQG